MAITMTKPMVTMLLHALRPVIFYFDPVVALGDGFLKAGKLFLC